MKNLFPFLFASLISATAFAQMQIDKSIEMTGTNTSDRAVTNLAPPVNGTDAANKDYVDAVAGGGGSSMPTMISNEGTAVTFGGAVQYCKNLVEGSFSDWRLPTFDELTFFVNDPGVSTNYLWSRTAANGKENPVNQNYMTMRLSDGKWRNGGEVAGLLMNRTASGSVSTTSFTTGATLTAVTSGNLIVVTNITLVASRNLTNSSPRVRLKFNFADGSFSIIPDVSYSSGYSFQNIFILNSVTPISSIEAQGQTDGSNTVNMTLTVSGYEISMTQADNATLATRCVR